MKALFLRENQVLSLEETARPMIERSSDVIVRVTAAAICASDVHFWKGEVPCVPNFILGHEFVGVVEEAGADVKRFPPGTRVAVPAMPFCGTCSGCRKGEYFKCRVSSMFGWRTPRANLAGGQAELVRVPFADNCLLPIPDSVADKQALFVGDILSTAYFGVTNGELTPGQDVAIFGAGPVGLCAVACARLFSPGRIILVDMEDNRLEMGSKMGATHTINASREEAVKTIKMITGKRGVDVSLDAVGLPSTLDDCINATTPGGIISNVGVGPSMFKVNIGGMFMKNLTFKTGLVNLNQMDRLMRLIEEGRLDVTPIITHEVSLDNIVEGYQMFADRADNCIKVMVVPGGKEKQVSR
ncbi:MAG: alcohol dehydrogenase catalytic domain-containing protein [Methylocystaceae bacterium]